MKIVENKKSPLLVFQCEEQCESEVDDDSRKQKKPLIVFQREEQSESDEDIYTSIALFLDFRIGYKTRKAPSLLKGLP
jgi:hypothetical protein